MKKTGFTLVEILIVVIILGILAAIVIPQFSSASETAKESNLKSDLLTLRNQLELYRVQHGDLYPWQLEDVGEDSEAVAEQMTSRTNEYGTTTEDFTDKDFRFGPYLDKIPVNLFVKDVAGPEVGAAFFFGDGPLEEGDGDDSTGWYVDTNTGKVYANTGREFNKLHYQF